MLRRCSPLPLAIALSFAAATGTAHATSNAQLVATSLVAANIGRWHLTTQVRPEGDLADRPPLSHISALPTERPRLLIPLYVSFAALQAMDAHSTLKAVSAGHVELNPLVAPSSRNAAAMAAMKVAVTTAVIVGMEKVWRHNRVAAVAAMIAVNGAYAAIVSHNYRNATR
jgi:hypothetical protein